MRCAWRRFASAFAQYQRSLRASLQLARQRATSCAPPPLSRLAQSRRLVTLAFGWRPVLVPELLRGERRVWRGEFAYEFRFIVDVLVQGTTESLL